MIAYPQGLPEGETVRDILENNEDLKGSAVNLMLNFRHLKKFYHWKMRRFGGLEKNWYGQRCCQILSVKMKNQSSLLKSKEYFFTY
jgi:hypothetical protein